MASAPTQNEATLDGTKTVYWERATEKTTLPTIMEVRPSVDADIFITKEGAEADSTVVNRAYADEWYPIYNNGGDSSKIQSNKKSGEADGTITIRVVAGV